MKRAALVILAIGVLIWASVAQAEIPAADPDYNAIQVVHLEATSSVQTWESKPLPLKATVYAHIFRDGHEIKQRWINSCSAHYVGGGLIVRVQVTNCNQKGRSTYRFRYASITRQQNFKIVLTTDPETFP